MITPSFALTATERVLPRMALDFTTATLDPRVTFTRTGNTATVTNSSGVIVSINADLPRFDFNPTTLACNGLLIEETRTNLLLNSLLDGTSLSTQIVVTTAVAHTLSFYGSGQIVLTGTSSATVTGTGAYPNRRTLTFTPTVGALTLTVTGTVQYAQLEVGAFVTSFIPTAGTAVARNADSAVMTGTNFSSWYNATEGALKLDFISSNKITSLRTAAFSDGTTANLMEMAIVSGAGLGPYLFVTDNSVIQVSANGGVTFTANTNYSWAMAYKLNSFAWSRLANTIVADNVGTVPVVNRFVIGADAVGSAILCGHIKKIQYWPQRLINAEVQAFSK